MNVLTTAHIATRRRAAPTSAPSGSGTCARCATTSTELVTARTVVSKSFTGFDGWADPSGRGLCPPCTWAYRTPALRQVPHEITTHPSCRALSRPRLRALLAHPVPTTTALVVPLRPGRKHLLPTAQWGRVTTGDATLTWTDADTARLAVMVTLRTHGFGPRISPPPPPPPPPGPCSPSCPPPNGYPPSSSGPCSHPGAAPAPGSTSRSTRAPREHPHRPVAGHRAGHARPRRPEGTAERLLLLLHYGIDWHSGWVASRRATYWDRLLPDRVFLATYRGAQLRPWWSEVADTLQSQLRSAEERRELEQLLRTESLPVLQVLRADTEPLLLRTRITADAVRATRPPRTTVEDDRLPWPPR